LKNKKAGKKIQKPEFFSDNKFLIFNKKSQNDQESP